MTPVTSLSPESVDDLIRKLEEATGPSDVLDLAIFKHLHPGWVKKPYQPRARHQVWFNERGEGTSARVEPCTSSIDAALTLVPQGHGWACMTHDKSRVEVGPGAYVDACRGTGATVALALCVAALRARPAALKSLSASPDKG